MCDGDRVAPTWAPWIADPVSGWVSVHRGGRASGGHGCRRAEGRGRAGASQDIGAGLVAAYRELGYAVIATSRTIDPSGADDIVTVQSDIADPATAGRIIDAGMERFWALKQAIEVLCLLRP